MKRRTTENLLLCVLGASISGLMPMASSDAEHNLIQESSSVAPTSAGEVRSSTSVKARTYAPPECFADQDVQVELARLQRELAEEQYFHRERWGTPMPPPAGWDPLAEAQRFRALLEGLPDRIWSTVDCTYYPCIGRFVTKESYNYQSLLDLPHAITRVSARMRDDETIYNAGIAFVEAPIEDQLARRWAEALIARQDHLLAIDISAVVEGHALAE